MQVGDRKRENRQENGWLRMAILVAGWLLIGSLAKDVWQLRGGFARISEAEKKLALELEKNANLNLRLEEVSTDEFKEKLIRENLNMQKEGETVVVMPKTIKNQSEVVTEGKETRNWEKWWNLID